MFMTPEEFAAWRNHLGWTKKRAAEEIGISPESIANYERGARPEGKVVIPKPVELACAALALGINRFSTSIYDQINRTVSMRPSESDGDTFEVMSWIWPAGTPTFAATETKSERDISEDAKDTTDIGYAHPDWPTPSNRRKMILRYPVTDGDRDLGSIKRVAAKRVKREGTSGIKDALPGEVMPVVPVEVTGAVPASLAFSEAVRAKRQAVRAKLAAGAARFDRGEEDDRIIGVGTNASGIEVNLTSGDQTLFGKFSGDEIRVDGEDLLIKKVSDLPADDKKPTTTKKHQ